VAAALLNLSFVAESLLPGPLRAGSTVVSDLSVPGQPWSWAFRLADAGSALCLLALCLLALRRPSPRRQRAPSRSPALWRLGWVATAAFAGSTLVASVVTETCAPATDPSCRDNLAVASSADIVHDAVSSGGTLFGVLAALAFAVVLRRTRWLAALHGTAFAVAASSGLMFVVLQARPDDGVSGWVQRVQILALSAWFVVLGLTASRDGRVSGPPPRGSAESQHEKMSA
jgi:hypothetical protein